MEFWLIDIDIWQARCSRPEYIWRGNDRDLRIDLGLRRRAFAASSRSSSAASDLEVIA